MHNPTGAPVGPTTRTVGSNVCIRSLKLSGVRARANSSGTICKCASFHPSYQSVARRSSSDSSASLTCIVVKGSTHRAGRSVVVGLGRMIVVACAAPAAVTCELVQHVGQRLDVEWFGQVRVEPGGARAFNVVAAAETRDRNH